MRFQKTMLRYLIFLALVTVMSCRQEIARWLLLVEQTRKRRKHIKLSTPQEIRRALARIANMMINGDDPKEANSLTLICNGILSAIRTDEQQKKIDELETACF